MVASIRRQCFDARMNKPKLQSRLSEIHTLITQSMLAQREADRHQSDELLSEAEERLDDLENEIAKEAD